MTKDSALFATGVENPRGATSLSQRLTQHFTSFFLLQTESADHLTESHYVSFLIFPTDTLDFLGGTYEQKPHFTKLEILANL